MSIKISVIDYGIGNVKSIMNALSKVECESILTRERDVLMSSDGLILPGVGAFAHGMEHLNLYSLDTVIHDFVLTGKPLLGICLGMQMLLESSDEFGTTKGLGLIAGSVSRLSILNHMEDKLPHVSWNEIKKPDWQDWTGTILNGIEDKENMYFVHSFAAVPANKDNILSLTEYSGAEFCSSVKKGNVYGCQFHPEKSTKEGLKIISNFVEICKEVKNG